MRIRNSFASRGRITRRAVLLAGAILLPIAPVSAQTAVTEDDEATVAAPESQEIVVTGTSIRGQAPVGATVQVVDSATLRASGLSNTNDALKNIPQVVNLGTDEGRGGGVQGAQANVSQAKTVNLRGLGTESTLVLLNGRRIAPAGTNGAGYDVSVFPVNSIARVEVVADGASAIYGSEAVGGVINFITNRKYEGAETFLRYGSAEGFNEKKFGQTFGYQWRDGGIFASYEHYQRGGLLGRERAEVTQDLRSVGGPDLRGTFGSPGTIIIGTTTYATPLGTRGVGLLPGQFTAGTANREDVNDTRSLLVDTNQDNGFLSAYQNLTPNLEIWAEGYFNDRQYTGFGSSLNRGTPAATIVVPRTNPFFVHPTNPAATSVNVNYSFTRNVGANTEGGERGYQVASGLTYRPFGNWSVDGMLSFSGNKAFRRADQLWSFNLTSILADSNPATAFNPFCDTIRYSDCNNPATIAKLQGYNVIEGLFHSTDAVIKANGSLLSLPGGDVSLAFGGEYMNSRLRTRIVQLTTAATETTRVTFARRTIKSGFAELAIPVFGAENETFGLHRLQLSAAIRTDEYSDFGRTTNPKFGITWAPFRGLSFRGSYGTSFRAPTLANIDFGNSATYSSIDIFDPSLGRSIRVIQLLGARDGLQPEKATTHTIGADFTPSAVPGLRASVTYYNIDYSNRITSVSSTNILSNQAVYGKYLIRNPDQALLLSYINSIYFRNAPENPANFVAIIDGRTSNLGGLKQNGIDGSISYAFSGLNSDWNVGATATKILKASQSPAMGLPYVDTLDIINNPVSFRARGTVGVSNGGFRLDAFVSHVGSYTNNLRTPQEKISSWTTLDLSVSYTMPESAGWARGLRLGLSLVNATDAAPPLVINTTTASEGLYDPQNASVTGRFVAFELSKKW